MSDDYPFKNTPMNNQAMGLLGLVDLKNTGKYPDTLSTQLLSVFEAKDLLSMNGREQLSFSGTFNAVGAQPVFPVPTNEIWQVINCNVRATCTIADYAMLSIGYDDPNAGRWFDEGTAAANTTTGAVAPAGTSIALAAAQRFWIPSGLQLGFYVHRIITAGTIAYQVDALIKRCRM